MDTKEKIGLLASIILVLTITYTVSSAQDKNTWCLTTPYKKKSLDLKEILENVTPAELEDIKPGQQWNATDPLQDNYR